MPDNTAEGKKALDTQKTLKDKTAEELHIGSGTKAPRLNEGGEGWTDGTLGARYGSPEATTLDQKIKWISQIAGQAPVVTVNPDPHDFEVLKKRGEAKAQLEFDTYMQGKLHLDDPSADPARFQWALEHYPQYFERRMTWMKEQEDIRKREASIRTFGLRTLDDYFYDFLKTTDRDFARKVNESIKGLFGSTADPEKSLAQGLISKWERSQRSLASGLGLSAEPRVSVPAVSLMA